LQVRQIRAGETMLSLGWIALYAAASMSVGLIVALAFLTFGVTRALPEPIPVSVGARFLFIPASVVLWPLVLQRWLKAKERE
jgi:hypothetical protein